LTSDNPEYPAKYRDSDTHVSKLPATHRATVGAALALLPLALWCLTHRYRGLVGDSELYAFQALSRIFPGLGRDVFLSTASQDRYTVFSPIYSFVIGVVGLRAAAISLLVLFKVCFYVAVFVFSRKLFDSRIALLTTVLAVVMPGEYGAYHVFRVAEDMLTARTVAEALAMAALCLHVYGRRASALGVAAAALCLHALTALPTILLLAGLNVGLRARILWGLVIVAIALGIASVAVLVPRSMPGPLAVMDAGWLEMVQERSQFVFLQLWRVEDWELNARPFLSLALGIVALQGARVRALCWSALVVGAAGLAIAFVAGTIGPVALLLQGQAWRWVWISVLVSMLTAVPTVARMWRSGGCGSLCAALLLLGWLFLAAGAYSIAAALCLWLWRRRIPAIAAPYFRFAATAMSVAAVAWIGIESWRTLASSLTTSSGAESAAVSLGRAIFALDGVPAIFAFFAWLCISRARSIATPAVMTLTLGAATALAAPNALADPRIDGADAQTEEFADWRAVIPPGANVFVVDRYYSAGFTWFTLHRPSYLTVDQSSGVIFSRDTAAEIRRRSEVLLPMEEPDWRLLTRRITHRGKFDAKALPLTSDRLVRICADPALNFVVAKEDVGFQPRRHVRQGPWNGWNLYDCTRVLR
jgi:hypothetical protein